MRLETRHLGLTYQNLTKQPTNDKANLLDDPKEDFKVKDPAFVKTDSAESIRVKNEILRMEQWENHVISHEMSHMVSGGSIIGAPSFIYQMGPNGKKYVVGGLVNLYMPSINRLMNDPVTLKQFESAAGSPGDPSPKDILASSVISRVARRVREKIQEKAAQKAYASNRKRSLNQMKEKGLYVSKLAEYEFQSIKVFDMML